MDKITSITLPQKNKLDISIRHNKLATYASIATTSGLYFGVDSFFKSQKALKYKMAKSTGAFVRGFLLATGAFTLFETVLSLVKNKTKS